MTAEEWSVALRELAPDHDAALDQDSLASTSQLVATGVAPVRSRKASDQPRSGLNVDGLELSVDLWATDVVEGEPVGAHVLVRNSTARPIGLDECNEASFARGLLPPGDTHHQLAYRGYTDCYGGIR